MGAHNTTLSKEQIRKLQKRQPNFNSGDRLPRSVENEIGKTVMNERNQSIVATNEMESETHTKTKSEQKGITVADFAKIKFEPEEHLNNKEHTTSQQEFPLEKEYPPGEYVVNNMIDLESPRELLNCGKFHYEETSTPKSYLESLNIDTDRNKLSSGAGKNLYIKQEILESHGSNHNILLITSDSKAFIDISSTEDNKDINGNIKSEIIEDSLLLSIRDSNENFKSSPTKILKVKSELGQTDLDNISKCNQHKWQHEKNKLLKNSFAFLNSSQNLKKSNRDCFLQEDSKKYSVNTEVKSELEHLNEDSHTSEAKLITIETSKTQDIILKKEPKENSEAYYGETNLKNNSVYNSSSSLNVNIDTLSNTDTDFNDVQAILINEIDESSKYYSIIEISAAEDEEAPTTLKSNSLGEKKEIKQRPYKKTTKNQKKSKTKQLNKNKLFGKAAKKFGRKPRNHTTSQYTEKAIIKARKNEKNKQNVSKKSTTNSAGNTKELPKPFEIETTTQKELSIATEVPRPFTFKCASKFIDVKNTQLYQQPAFQPNVQLKRLKIDDILIPLRSTKVKACFKKNICHSAKRYNNYPKNKKNNDQKDLLIHQVCSLNPRFKLNRDYYSYDNKDDDQPSLYSCITAPSNDNINSQFNDTESKYFSQQDLLSSYDSNDYYQSSLYSCTRTPLRIESGIATSTPTTFRRPVDNQRLLLEIAAERAFINNHLIEFGYSPIQFHLYNDLNELNIFLKYLISKDN